MVNSKDNRELLDFFRTDAEDALIELQPRKHRKVQKMDHQQASQTAILSLCLVTGLSAGVGHTFASDKVESLPDTPALDQISVDNQIEVEESSQPVQSYKEVPDIPVLNQAPVEEEQKNESKNETPLTNEQEDSGANTKDVEKEKKEVDEEKEVSDKKGEEEKEVPLEQKSKQSKSPNTQEKDEFDSTSSKKEPITEGGKLPDTAGENPNQLVFGGVIAALGSALLAQRKRKKKNDS